MLEFTQCVDLSAICAVMNQQDMTHRPVIHRYYGTMFLAVDQNIFYIFKSAFQNSCKNSTLIFFKNVPPLYYFT